MSELIERAYTVAYERVRARRETEGRRRGEALAWGALVPGSLVCGAATCLGAVCPGLLTGLVLAHCAVAAALYATVAAPVAAPRLYVTNSWTAAEQWGMDGTSGGAGTLHPGRRKPTGARTRSCRVLDGCWHSTSPPQLVHALCDPTVGKAYAYSIPALHGLYTSTHAYMPTTFSSTLTPMLTPTTRHPRSKPIPGLPAHIKQEVSAGQRCCALGPGRLLGLPTEENEAVKRNGARRSSATTGGGCGPLVAACLRSCPGAGL